MSFGHQDLGTNLFFFLRPSELIYIKVFDLRVGSMICWNHQKHY